jgi:DNA polymerase
MESESNETIFERVAQFLRQQRNIYGDFETQINSTYTEKSIKDDLVSEPETNFELAQPSTIEKKLAACSSLTELKSLCEESEVLKTDLNNTNLVFGTGNPTADLMIIGEAPGKSEDQQGVPFIGKAGKLLDKILNAINFNRNDVYIANILKHRPPQNRDPKPDERKRSLPFLLKQIELVNPKLILCAGKVSGNTLLNSDLSLKQMRQKFHDFNGIELMVTYHPAALLRSEQWKKPTWEDVQQLRARYDELKGNP